MGEPPGPVWKPWRNGKYLSHRNSNSDLSVTEPVAFVNLQLIRAIQAEAYVGSAAFWLWRITLGALGGVIKTLSEQQENEFKCLRLPW
jgi:hypothetical protein